MKNLQKGTRFGNLVIKQYSHDDKYICKCDCGRETVCSEEQLLSGAKTSCGVFGCQVDMLDQKYGYLTVIDVNKNLKKNKQLMVKCKCDCGNEKLINPNAIKRGLTKSCGCFRKKMTIEKLDSMNEANKQKREQANKNMTEILTKLDIPFKKEYRFEDCRDKKPLPFDFAVFNEIEELIGLIELNGSQHYATIPRDFYTEEHLAYIKHHDYLKQKFCVDNDIPLLVIPYQYFGKEKLQEFLLSSDFWTLIQARSTTK